MRHAVSLTLIAAIALTCVSCDNPGPDMRWWNRKPGYSTEFIAGNPTSVLIDFEHGSDSELNAAHMLAVNRCALFGRNGGAVLDSINPREDGTDRASFLCQ